MPSNSKSNTPKSKVAGKGPLNKQYKFDWRVIVAIAIILIAALGYLYVRLSRAAGYIWTPTAMSIGTGELGTKQGRAVVMSKYVSLWPAENIYVTVDSSLTTNDTYCIDGMIIGSGGQNWNFTANYKESWGGSQQTGIGSKTHGALPTGNFTKCIDVPANTTGKGRYIGFDAHGATNDTGAKIYIYSIYRKGTQPTPIAPVTPSGVKG